MLTIQPLTQIEPAVLQQLVFGYETNEIYRVVKSEADALTTFELRLFTLSQPYVKRWDEDTATTQHLLSLIHHGSSFAAYDDDVCVAIAINETQHWNSSLTVQEFHVTPAYRGQGVGRLLMETVADYARSQGLRILVCETQSTNVPAIRFYRALGFVLDSIDLSLYSNQDYPDREIAIFMKRYLQPGNAQA
jgi:ribosomal protein S18 acetylase RimI-like enzyme